MEKLREKIRFYKKDDPYGWMSNFHRATIDIDGIDYKTSEHYYQSRKAISGEYADWIAKAPTPHIAFKAARCLKPDDIRPDWDDIKVSVMEKALRAKFSQHPDLAKKLLDTGDAILIEDSPVDSFWGSGKDCKGQNMLGKLLMDIRENLVMIGSGFPVLRAKDFKRELI